MATVQWEPIIRRWSEETIERLDEPLLAQLSTEARVSRWLGVPGASAAEIASLEQRISRPLPDSYTSFLRVTNGMFLPMHGVTQLYAATDVDWFATRSPDALQAWLEGSEDRPSVPDADYLRYDAHQDPAHFRVEYLSTALEVGSMANEDVLLLNPRVLTSDGEWECLFLAFWLPGAQRYRSFVEGMEAMHQEFLEDLPGSH